MKSRPLLSVIVPVYNVEPYLKRCLDSIINQTYRELEIICVDDGSTDGSGEILDEYAKADSRVTVIHKSNGGESAARNSGLDIVSGEYFTFVDDDDWIESPMYETLIREATINEADMSLSRWYKSYADRDVEIYNELPVENKIIDRDELLRYIYMRDSYRGFAYMWNKLYKTELLNRDESPLRFDEDIRLGGDAIFLCEMALRAKKAVYVDEAFYHYFQHGESGCHTEDLDKHMDWVRSYEFVINRLVEEGVDSETADYARRFLAYHSCEAAAIAILNGEADYLNKFRGYMSKYLDVYERLNADHPDRIERYREVLGV